MNGPKQLFTDNRHDFEIAKKIAIELTPILHEKTKGHVLITLQTLDFLNDAIVEEAIKMKNMLDAEKRKEKHNKGNMQ